jgi:glycosyltransferase involved in cell wall biosynthesis
LIKVAFWYDRPAEYSGGLNYLRNLLYALSCAEERRIQPYIFFGKTVSAEIVRPFETLATVVRTSILDRKSAAWFAHQVLHRIFGSLRMIQWALRPFGISIVSHPALLFGRRRPFRIISWIPDFQHLHLPELFPHDIDAHTRLLLKIAAQTDALVLSSFAALSDFRRLAGSKVSTSVVVLQFVSQPTVSANESQALPVDLILQKYGIASPYFFLPNQFWKHKNHAVVFSAVKALVARGLPILVVCSGNLRDYRVRDMQYVDGLVQFIDVNDLGEHIKILGQIDYSDVLCLMRNSVSVINPSRFEGWSSTVEEARSMGQRLILSRIPVHLEQNPENVAYFDPDDHAALADLMAAHWKAGHIGVGDKQCRRAATELHERTIAYGTAYSRLVEALDAGMLEKRVYESLNRLPPDRRTPPAESEAAR